MRHRLVPIFGRVHLLSALLVWPLAASAEPRSPPAGHVQPLAQTLTGAAKDAFTSAQILLNNGDFAGALTKYQEAYGLSKEPRLLFNMALCERGLHAYARMQILLRQYRREAAASISAEDRADVDNALAAIQKLVGSVRLAVNEPGATVAVDDEPAGFTPLEDSVVLDLGRHSISVTKAGFDRATQAVSIVGGDEIAVSVTLVPQRQFAQIVIASDDASTVFIDDKVVGKGRFEGQLSPGPHDVGVTESGKRPYRAEVDLRAGETRTLQVTLESEHRAALWPWIVGGAVLAAGAVVGGYFLLKPSDTVTPVPPGSFAGATFSSWRP